MATMIDLADEAGCSPEQVARWLKSQGIKRRRLSDKLPQSVVARFRQEVLRRSLSFEELVDQPRFAERPGIDEREVLRDHSTSSGGHCTDARTLGHSSVLGRERASEKKIRELERSKNQGADRVVELPEGIDPVAVLRQRRARLHAQAQTTEHRGEMRETKEIAEATRGAALKKEKREQREQLELISEESSGRPTPRGDIEHYYEQRYHALLKRYKTLDEKFTQLSRQLDEVVEHQDNALRNEQSEHSSAPPTVTILSASPSNVRGEERPFEAEPPKKAPLTLWRRLGQLHLDDVSLLPALAMLIADPGRGPSLLSRLRCAKDFDPFIGTALCCEAPSCQSLASAKGTPLLAPLYYCMICEGNEGRRWYQWLRAQCLDQGYERLLIVGGSEDGQQNLRSFDHEHPGLRWQLITGGAQIHQRQAQQLCQSASLVVLWPSDYLTHRVSDLFRAAAQREACPVVTVPPGKRSIISLAETILISLDALPPETSPLVKG